MNKIIASEIIKRLSRRTADELEKEVTKDIGSQLEECLGYPAPFSVRLLLDKDDASKITDVEIVPKRSTIARAAQDFTGYLRADIMQALKQLGTIHATGIYTGEDGSMGFKRGQTYRFTLTAASGWRKQVNLRTEEGLLHCPYSSIDALLRYWHILRVWSSESDNGTGKRVMGGGAYGKR